MFAHGGGTDSEDVADLGVGLAAHNPAQHLALPGASALIAGFVLVTGHCFPFQFSAFQGFGIILFRCMRMLIRKLFPVCVAAVLVGCSNGPVEYAADNSGGVLHQISTDPDEIFRNKVDHEAELEARGVEPPVGNASWRDYWIKMIAYWTGTGAYGTHQQVMAYIVQQRRARGLPAL
jgi:hypothetical protein